MYEYKLVYAPKSHKIEYVPMHTIRVITRLAYLQIVSIFGTSGTCRSDEFTKMKFENMKTDSNPDIQKFNPKSNSEKHYHFHNCNIYFQQHWIVVFFHHNNFHCIMLLNKFFFKCLLQSYCCLLMKNNVLYFKSNVLLLLLTNKTTL